MVRAIGDVVARPKGGTLEYRSVWHHASQPKGLYLKAKTQGRQLFLAMFVTAAVRKKYMHMYMSMSMSMSMCMLCM